MIYKANIGRCTHEAWIFIVCAFDIDKGGLFNLVKLLSFDTENTNNIWCLRRV